MPLASTNIRALEDAKDIANRLVFWLVKSDNISKISQTYLYSGKAKSIFNNNIITGEYAISYDFTSDPSTLYSKPLSLESSTQQAESFIKQGKRRTIPPP